MANQVTYMDAATQVQLRTGIRQVPRIPSNPTEWCFSCLASVIGIAILVIGSMGAAGHFTNPTFGWTVAGLGGGLLLFSIVGAGALKGKNWKVLIGTFLTAGAYVTVGVLGGMNILTSTQVGWGVVGTILSCIGIGIFVGCCVTPCVMCCCPQVLEQAANSALSNPALHRLTQVVVQDLG